MEKNIKSIEFCVILVYITLFLLRLIQISGNCKYKNENHLLTFEVRKTSMRLLEIYYNYFQT